MACYRTTVDRNAAVHNSVSSAYLGFSPGFALVNIEIEKPLFPHIKGPRPEEKYHHDSLDPL